jgi:hypothetical protein
VSVIANTLATTKARLQMITRFHRRELASMAGVTDINHHG